MDWTGWIDWYMDDEALLTAFTDALQYYWGQRLKQLFPDRDFIFETGYEIEGELGFAVTFYQRRAFRGGVI